MGEQPPGLRLTCRNAIPHARGLGLVVGGDRRRRRAGPRAGRRAGRSRLDDAARSRSRADLEGHPDNVAAGLLGGFVDLPVGTTADVLRRPRRRSTRGVRAVVFVPPTGAVDRGRPRPAARRRAARRRRGQRRPGGAAGRRPGAAGPSSSAPATATACTRSTAARRCRTRSPWSTGCAPTGHAAVVSGAGPTVLVLTDDDADLASYAPTAGRTSPLDVATDGVRSADSTLRVPHGVGLSDADDRGRLSGRRHRPYRRRRGRGNAAAAERWCYRDDASGRDAVPSRSCPTSRAPLPLHRAAVCIRAHPGTPWPRKQQPSGLRRSAGRH